MFPVSEETATADDLGNFRRNHLVPAADALEHVAGKDRQKFRIRVVELHETASTDEIIEEQLQVGFRIHVMDGL
jgi:hypothetical protein